MVDINKVVEEHAPGLEFFITGTHAYGPARPDSDLDIVVKLKDISRIALFLADHGIKFYKTPGQDEYGPTGGFYFSLAGIEVNIIIAEDELDFEEWRRRTERMKKFAPIHDKEERKLIFNEKEEYHG